MVVRKVSLDQMIPIWSPICFASSLFPYMYLTVHCTLSTNLQFLNTNIMIIKTNKETPSPSWSSRPCENIIHHNKVRTILWWLASSHHCNPATINGSLFHCFYNNNMYWHPPSKKLSLSPKYVYSCPSFDLKCLFSQITAWHLIFKISWEVFFYTSFNVT